MRFFVPLAVMASAGCLYPDDEPVDVGCADPPPACADDCVTNREVVQERTRGYRIVFVPEGYTAEGLDDWRLDVAVLVQDLMSDPKGIFGLAPDLFTIERVDAPSASRDVARGSRTDTILGACLRRDSLGGRTPLLAVDPTRTGFIARGDNLTPVDVAVVIVNGLTGRANAPFADVTSTFLGTDGPTSVFAGSEVSPRLIVMRRDQGSAVLEHELGHALIGLGDEYTDVDGCYPEDGPRFTTEADLRQPNLTLDPAGSKWADVVEGTELGGSRYGSCIYHPRRNVPCRMEDHDYGYCPVCMRAIEEALIDRSGRDAAPPRCVIETNLDPLAVSDWLWVHGRAVDRSRGVSARLTLDGVHVGLLRAPNDLEGSFSIEILPEQVREEGSTLELVCSDRFGNSTTTTVALERGDLLIATTAASDAVPSTP